MWRDRQEQIGEQGQSGNNNYKGNSKGKKGSQKRPRSPDSPGGRKEGKGKNKGKYQQVGKGQERKEFSGLTPISSVDKGRSWKPSVPPVSLTPNTSIPNSNYAQESSDSSGQAKNQRKPPPPPPMPTNMKQISSVDKGKGKGNDNGKGKKGGNKGYAPVKEEPIVKEEPKEDRNKGKGGSNLKAPETNFTVRTTDTTRQFLTSSKFEDLKISNELKRSLSSVFKYETMTEVQSQTLPVILQNHDVFARAKTGTGKTLAFLTPTIERLLQLRKVKSEGPKNAIQALVLSPTRELSCQIFEEAKALTTYLPNFNTVIIYGGTPMKKDKQYFNTNVDILVATPGRLIDHLENTVGIPEKIKNAKSLILDEADQLLEIGFLPAITKIAGYLNTDRQSLLFSATVAPAVRKVAGICLKNDYQFVDCVGDDNEATVQHADQSLGYCEIEDLFGTLVSLVKQAMEKNPNSYKIICFFVTARQTQCLAYAFNNLGIKVDDIHSRKNQSQRTKSSGAFRNCTKGVLFSSDVSARGMDYPNVTNVIQVGAPSAREQYIHRLGRTARAGETGSGVLLLHPFEDFFMKFLSDLPITNIGDHAFHKMLSPYWPDDADLVRAMKNVQRETRCQCYSAWLGFYNGLCPKKIKWSKAELVQWANHFSNVTLKLEEVPGLMKKTIGKMGLRDVPGLRIQK